MENKKLIMSLMFFCVGGFVESSRAGEQPDSNATLVINRTEFDEKLKKARKLGFIEWINGHKKRRS